MEKSNIEKIKEAVVYAPVGAFGFVKDNAPTFFSMFVSRGKKQITRTTFSTEDKISNTKEHGQMIAMGTPVVKEKADKLANEAKSKGQQIASFSIDAALGALNFVEGTIRNVTSNITSNDNQKKTQVVKSPNLTSVTAAASTPEAKIVDSPPIVIDKSAPLYNPQENFVEEFIAEPVDPALPERLKAEYERLSAPEIIDRLDQYSQSDLRTIREYEADFRNRQTIIHAINYRLNDNL
ncbi:MAG: hypothetical protein U0R17_00565 [Acidimicrobiia bacterium]